MFARFAPVALLVTATAALYACSAAPTGSLPDRQEANQTDGESSSNNKDNGNGGGGSAADAGKAGANNTGGGDTETPGKGGKPDVPETPADPGCVANCNAGLKDKCDGDDEFCDDICQHMDPAQVTCLIAAPGCEKAEWIRCAEENPGDAGTGTKPSK